MPEIQHPDKERLEVKKFKKKSNSLRPNASLKVEADRDGQFHGHENISTPGFRKSKALSSENLLD